MRNPQRCWASDCNALSTAEVLSIFVGTVAEVLIVADRRGVGPEMRRLIDERGFTVAPVKPAMTRHVGVDVEDALKLAKRTEV